jgi:hypothetical protein
MELVRRNAVSGSAAADVFILRQLGGGQPLSALEHATNRLSSTVQLKYANSQQIDKVFEGEGLQAASKAGTGDSPTVALGAVASFNTGLGPCTGFHIGNGRVVTAGHCFSADATPGLIQNFGCSVRLSWSDGGNSTCLRGRALQFDDARDFALLDVTPAPTAAIRVRPGKLDLHEPVWVLGFPGEGKFLGTLVWSKPCSSEPPDLSPYERWRTPGRFCHKCGTEPGMSGAPVIDADGTIVGIHNGGFFTDELLKLGWNTATRLSEVRPDE